MKIKKLICLIFGHKWAFPYHKLTLTYARINKGKDLAINTDDYVCVRCGKRRK